MSPNIPQQPTETPNIDVEEKPKNRFTIHHILLNTPLRILLVLVLMAVILPCILYVYVYSQRIFTVRDNQILGTCSHNNIYHVRCGSFNLTEKMCEDRQCCFTKQNGCFHSLPSRYQYDIKNEYDSNIIFNCLQSVTPFGSRSTPNLRLITKNITASLLRIELWDNAVFGTQDTSSNPIDTTYKFRIFQNTMFSVDRLNGQALLTTSRGPLIVSENYLEWNFHMNSPYLYGLGEGILNYGFKKLLFNSEQDNFIPFIIAYDPESNDYHAVSFKTPGPLEIEITESNLIIVKALYSKYFIVDLYTGPKLQDILKVLQPKLRSFPEWMLGIHVCRQEQFYNMTASVQELNNFLELGASRFPFDSHCYHENLVNLQNIDTVLRNSQILVAIDSLRSQNKTFFVPLHLELDVDQQLLSLYSQNMLQHPRINNVPYQGLIGNRSVVYVDWMRTDLNDMLKDIWQVSASRMELIDGFLIQGNWMKDESSGLKILDSRLFQYIPEGISDRLQVMLPWNTKLSDSEDIILDSINLMSYYQIDRLRDILGDKLMMTSSFNLDMQDQAVLIHSYPATWSSLRASANRLVSMGLNGHLMAGSQVCGDLDNESLNQINEELCIRWYQFAAMTPIFRIRSDRTPDKFSAYATRLMNNAISKRYSLVSYFQTVLSTSNPLITPMFYQYPELMINATELAGQFNIGEALLIAPILMAQATHKTIYFPNDFYELYGGMLFESNTTVEFPVVESDFPIFLRSGFIIALHNTTDIWDIRAAQVQPLKLIVGLETKVDSNTETTYLATGNLIINANYSLKFDSTDKQFAVSITSIGDNPQILTWDEFCMTHNDKLYAKTIESVTLYGLEEINSEISINLKLCEPDNSVIKENGLYIIKYNTTDLY